MQELISALPASLPPDQEPAERFAGNVRDEGLEELDPAVPPGAMDVLARGLAPR